MLIVFVGCFFFGIFLQELFVVGEYFRLTWILLLLSWFFWRKVGCDPVSLKYALAGIVSGVFWSYLSIDFFGENIDFWTLDFLQKLRDVSLLKLKYLYSSTHSAFLAGLLIGERSSIPPDLGLAFNITGLTHIVAISGYNISLVILLVFKIFMFLSQKSRIIAASIFIVLFVCFVGFSAPVLRAAIMGVVALLGMFLNREYLALRGLFISGFLMVFFDVRMLTSSISFQLSFLATLGILFFADSLKNFFSFLPSKFAVRESVVMTFAAQILVLPVILVNFGNLSIISPLANLFVLPFIPLTMFFGFLSLIVSIFADFLALILAFFNSLLLDLMIFFVEFFAKVPFAQVDLDWVSFELCVLYYFSILWYNLKIIFKKSNEK